MVYKKRAKKPLDDEENNDIDDIKDIDMNAVTDSEEEYTETEKKLLEKVRKQCIIENYDSDDEVYGLQDDSEEEEQEDDQQDSMEFDIEGLKEEDYDMPNDRAWGNRAKTFYSSDFKYTDYASAPQKDLINADMEEDEGKKLHMRSMEEHLAFEGSNLIGIVQTMEDCKEDQEDNEQVSDEKSFMFIVDVFKDCMTEINDILAPFLKLVENGTCPDCDAATFVRTKYHILLNYCINVSFCLILKVKGLPVKSHPVVKRLAQYRQLLDQLQSKQGNLLEQVTEILKAVKEDKPLYSISNGSQIQTHKKILGLGNINKKLKRLKETEKQDKQEQLSSDTTDEEASMDEADLYNDETADSKDDILDTTNEEKGKRAITYQIAKNRGLTPYRKKELRNPRVKHRNKYRKAKIRRKGAVREVRKELTRYEGEISGIKAGVKKGIKLK
ncbi:something about silencing protein 10 [Linepithema humile]|uniref:something about silencing protein 10 n=1 Tax=Linepithema humile TaxID=83485 RepID=UPI00062306FC|nr:PREDICTED: something about silencing protein 10 [Linepithema humile]